MMVGIYAPMSGAGIYQRRPIDDLADILHPMAVVAWDRDMGDVELRDGGDVWPALRFMIFSKTKAWVYTDEPLAVRAKIGEWDPIGERWVPTSDASAATARRASEQ